MKKFSYLIILIICFFTGCRTDDPVIDNSDALPTVFEGRLLYSDTNEPVSNARLTILANEGVAFRGGRTVERFEIFLDESSQGEFSFTFMANSVIDDFTISADFFDEVNPNLLIGGADLGNFVCSPINCLAFIPGTVYTDLTFLVDRP